MAQINTNWEAGIFGGDYRTLHVNGINKGDFGISANLSAEEAYLLWKTKDRKPDRTPVDPDLRLKMEDSLKSSKDKAMDYSRTPIEKPEKLFVKIVDLDYDIDISAKTYAERLQQTWSGQDAVTYIRSLNLQCGDISSVPQKLEYEVNSNFAAIASLGRNNPFYHYTGSEDTITFEIDWVSMTPDLSDVISKCKWLESMTKANAYKYQPHRVALLWGDLFNIKDTWLITKASYILGQFDGLQGILPHIAKQQVEMKRITKTNRTLREIRDFNRTSDFNEGLDLLKKHSRI